LVVVCAGFAAYPRAIPGHSEHCLPMHMYFLSDVVKVLPPCWKYLLTDLQRTYLDTYTRLWTARYGTDPATCPSCIFDLLQNPEFRPRMSHNGKLPSILRNSNRFWSPCLRRWLVPKELAACHGYPVTRASRGIAHLMV